jgi:hypothetical protein
LNLPYPEAVFDIKFFKKNPKVNCPVLFPIDIADS